MTMTYKVFHAREVRDTNGRVVDVKGRFGFEPTTFPGDYQHVATVEAQALGHVFELTNHIDQPWYENLGVVVPTSVDVRRLRSTSVGDVVSAPDGFYAVAPLGYVKVEMDENFNAAVPKLYGHEGPRVYSGGDPHQQ